VHEIGGKEIEGRNKWKRENLINTTEIWRKREYKWDEKKSLTYKYDKKIVYVAVKRMI